MSNDVVDLTNVRLGMSRKQVVELLGEPEATGGTSRKQRIPLIYKYGHVELTFGPREHDGLLRAVTQDHVDAANDVVEAVLKHLATVPVVGDELEWISREAYDALESALAEKVNEALKPYIAPEEISLNV